MTTQRIRLTLALGLSAVLASWALPTVSRADFSVGEGFDLFITQTGTTFDGTAFEGVPLGTFDFGNGAIDTGPTDTIVHRDALPDLGGAGTGQVNIELVALSLVSVDPVDIGGGMFETLFTTLTFDRTGLEADRSTGTLDITVDDMSGGTFDSFLDVFFDLRIGGFDGTIVAPRQEIQLSANDVPWGREPPPANVIPLIDGPANNGGAPVNRFLNGTDSAQDFWSMGAVEECTPGVDCHVVSHTPAPGAALLGVMGLGLVGWVRRRLS